MNAEAAGLGGWVAAVDLGATSGRVMLGFVSPTELTVREVHRFPNEPRQTPDGLHWDLEALWTEVLTGLHSALAQQPDVVSIGVDAWAVDYGVLRTEGLAGPPFHYRDDRTATAVSWVHDRINQTDLYAATGLQFLPFNTVYQLVCDQAAGRLDESVTLVLIPDLFGERLTGVAVAERTNASTTGLLEPSTGEWNVPLIERLGLPVGMFPPVIDPGTSIGPLVASLAAELKATSQLEVVAVGSHDTASAVVAVPMVDRRSAYISSGTWSLVGVELDAPVLSDPTFTNEGGVDGRVRYLRNVMGLWLLSESMRTWAVSGDDSGLDELLSTAAQLEESYAVFDVNDPSLLPTGDLPRRIANLCKTAGGPVPHRPAEFVRAICESLAQAYAVTLADAERNTGVQVETVHVVGGGSKNELLCQLTADRCGRRVLAGPVEATAIGNVLIQARAAGFISGSLEDLRQLVASTFAPTEYRPRDTGLPDTKGTR